MAEVGDSASYNLVRPALDAVLELIDLVVERIGQLEEALGDQVDDAERRHACRAAGAAADGHPETVQGERSITRGCLAAGDNGVVGH